MANLAQLKNKRTGLKIQLSRIETFTASIDSSVEVYLLQVKLNNLIGHYEAYQVVQSDIISLSPPEENIAEATAAEDDVADRFEACIAKLSSAIDKKNKCQVEVTENANVILPKINIKPFTGNQSEWASFFDLFSALVLNNTKLQSKSEKLYYLKSLLRGQPLELIDSLSVTNSNLDVALQILRNNYEDKSKLIHTLFSEFVEQKPLSKSNATGLKDFYISSKKTIDLIKNLGLKDEENFETLVVFLLEQKLDFQSRKAFESEREPGTLSTISSFFDFLKKRFTVLENVNVFEPVSKKEVKTSENRNKVSMYNSVGQKANYPSNSFNVNNSSNSASVNKFTCVYCNERNHAVSKCNKFGTLSSSDRYKFAKSSKLCINCLSSQHLVSACKSLHRCLSCGKTHHTLLHFDQNSNTRTVSNTFVNPTTSGNNNLSTTDANVNSTSQTSLSVTAFTNQIVLLPTALVNVHCKNGQILPARLLLDSASQISVIKKAYADNLNLPTRPHSVSISGLGKGNCNHTTNVMNIVFSSMVEPFKTFNLTCAVMDNITNKLPQFSISPNKIRLPSHVKIELADPLFYQPGEIQILVGADLYFNLLKNETISLGANMPTLVSTHLGYVVAGPVPNQVKNLDRNNFVLSFLAVNDDVCSEENNLTKLVEKFWEMEEVPIDQEPSSSDKLAERRFLETTKILPNGRYQVDMPILDNSNKKLGHSFSIAKRRFTHLENKFSHNNDFFKTYKQVLFDYVSLGHARLVPLSLFDYLSNEIKYFVPHRAVIRNSSVSSKCRIVFDYSSRTETGISLNDITLKGYQVQDNLFDIICRFRSFRFVLCADIQMMYRMIEINPTQRHLQNVLWRETPTTAFESIELSRLSFGQNCSPFLATRVLKDIADKNPSYPLAQAAILSQTYMDDILSGVSNVEHLNTLYSELNTVLNRHGFFLHKWQSNSPDFLDSLSLETNVELDLNLDNSPCKILGLKWNSSKDMLQIGSSSIPNFSYLTKRIILSIISSTFDPAGFVNPLILFGKLIMQSLWQLKLEWDTPIQDPCILKQWQSFVDTLSQISELSIPRYLLENKQIINVTLHGFCDASQVAYGCCVYLVAFYSDGTLSSQLIASKSRVNPLKTKLTIPKLELSAMVLLSKLTSRLVNIFAANFKFHSINLWSDSLVALSWVKRSAGEFSMFVSRRVHEIQENSIRFIWRHIRSHENPADILSRGKFSKDVWLFWLHGPTFLQETREFDSLDTFTPVDFLPETKKVSLINLKTTNNILKDWFQEIPKFTKLQRCLAYLFRYLNNTRKNSSRLAGPLSVKELQQSHDFIIKQIQKEYFAKEIDSLLQKKPVQDKLLLPLNIFLDDDRILRVGGRLQHANFSYDKKFPILLPSNDSLVHLLIEKEHIRLGHSGPQNGNLRQRYWPLGGIRLIKRILSKCVTCYRFNVQFSSQLMSPLPVDRVSPARAFAKVGVDFAGPISILSSRLRKSPVLKGYIAIFVCMVTKAVHIEIVTSLTTDAFIASLKRFIGRRGNPQVIYSDNGSNFVGARNQLKELSEFFRSHETFNVISSYLSLTEISWKFIPARSPHWGGLWEAAVKSTKSHMIKLLGSATFTYEETATILTQIEAVLNSRPLYPLSDSPNDFLPLTPGHFLIGCSLTSFPEKDIAETPSNRLTFWKQCEKIYQTFWKRWSTDYLHQLQHRPKWQKVQKDLAINDLVLVLSEDRPPLNWPLARVIELLPGKDGKVRAAKIKTSDGVYTRPIVKLAVLPLRT